MYDIVSESVRWEILAQKVQVESVSSVYVPFLVECRAAQGDVRPQTEGGPAGAGQAEPAEEQAFGPSSGHSGSSSGQ